MNFSYVSDLNELTNMKTKMGEAMVPNMKIAVYKPLQGGRIIPATETTTIIMITSKSDKTIMSLMPVTAGQLDSYENRQLTNQSRPNNK